jgi:predicted nucleotidyltransferase component of viral defense system
MVTGKYRVYSEDLDFTLLDDNITNEQIFEWFKQTFEFVRAEANIPLETIDNNENSDSSLSLIFYNFIAIKIFR